MKIKSEKSVLLVGAGPMAVDYAKVLLAMEIPTLVIGRGERSAKKFQNATKLPVELGGIKKWLIKENKKPPNAIVAVSGNNLGFVTKMLIEYGITNILIEKPGGLDKRDIESVAKAAKKKKSIVLVAYNRRFYASTLKAKDIIKEDGGVKSFTFEFTEWSHVIEKIENAERIKENWFLHNSTHTVNLAFYLGGIPTKIQCYKTGSLEWHPSGSIFTGAGISNIGALFSYHANWESPGRWGVEILTNKHRLIFRPLEKLKIQNIGSVAIEEVGIDDELDVRYKPGLYRQVDAFLNSRIEEFIDIHEQVLHQKIYDKINY